MAVVRGATGSVFRDIEREAITRFEEEYQVQLAMVISQSDPDGLEDPDLVQIKAAKQISLGCGGRIDGDAMAMEMEMLSLRYRVRLCLVSCQILFFPCFVLKYNHY